MRTPVVFMTFNRPHLAREVLTRIAAARPPLLYHIQDGPRQDHPEDAACCAACIDMVNRIDWPCEIRRIHATHNLGCGLRIATGLNQVFAEVEEAILLEDDCLPGEDFFPFCERMLERYRDTPRVMHISGDNFQQGRNRTPYNHDFSRYAHIWGWATWRRAWALYDRDMKEWPAFRDGGGLASRFADPGEQAYWTRVLNRMHAGEIDTWDYPWQFTCLLHDGVCVLPAANLVSNIGFGVDATHTIGGTGLRIPRITALPRLPDPPDVRIHTKADSFTFRHLFQRTPNLPTRCWRRFRSWMKRLLRCGEG